MKRKIAELAEAGKRDEAHALEEKLAKQMAEFRKRAANRDRAVARDSPYAPAMANRNALCQGGLHFLRIGKLTDGQHLFFFDKRIE